MVLQESLGSSSGGSGLTVQPGARMTQGVGAGSPCSRCLPVVGIQMLQHILSEQHLVAGLLTRSQRRSSHVKNYAHVFGV